MLRIVLAIAGSAAFALPALAQTNIADAHKHAWLENCGWTNWRDANGGASGVRIQPTFLSGSLWSENLGWISLGDGTPAAGPAYANLTGADSGVNILGNGDLSGLGWSENVGWINFGTAPFVPLAQRARFDAAARRFRGYAWGENIGWLNLDDATHYVALSCYPDCNASGTLTIADFGCFQAAFAAGNTYADCNASGTLTIADFGCFQAQFAAGCP
jgi:hypothetical protein